MILTIIGSIIILSILMAAHEFGHFVATRAVGVPVLEFGFGFPPRLLRIARIAGTDFTLNAIPFGAFVRPAGEGDPNTPGGLESKGRAARFLVAIGGPVMNILLAIVVFAAAYMAGWPSVSAYKHVLVIGVQAGSPAADAGLKVGDVVISADGQDMLTPEQFITYTAAHRGQTVTLSVKRGDKTSDVALIPRADPPPGQGAIGIGISPAPEKVTVVHYGPIQAVGRGLGQAWGVFTATVSLPGELLRGTISPDLARPVGPVGIVQITGSAAAEGARTGWWQPLLNIVGAISLALGITNLLPLPALDGGHILFIVVEAIRGRRVDPQREAVVHFIGLVLLVALLIVITYKDIASPVPNYQLPSPF